MHKSYMTDINGVGACSVESSSFFIFIFAICNIRNPIIVDFGLVTHRKFSVFKIQNLFHDRRQRRRKIRIFLRRQSTIGVIGSNGDAFIISLSMQNQTTKPTAIELFLAGVDRYIIIQPFQLVDYNNSKPTSATIWLQRYLLNCLFEVITNHT